MESLPTSNILNFTSNNLGINEIYFFFFLNAIYLVFFMYNAI
jgi:hypothetical protein